MYELSMHNCRLYESFVIVLLKGVETYLLSSFVERERVGRERTLVWFPPYHWLLRLHLSYWLYYYLCTWRPKPNNCPEKLKGGQKIALRTLWTVEILWTVETGQLCSFLRPQSSGDFQYTYSISICVEIHRVLQRERRHNSIQGLKRYQSPLTMQ